MNIDNSLSRCHHLSSCWILFVRKLATSCLCICQTSSPASIFHPAVYIVYIFTYHHHDHHRYLPSKIRLHMKLEITMTQPQPPSGGRGTSSRSSSWMTLGSEPTLNLGLEPIVIITGLEPCFLSSFLSSIPSFIHCQEDM